MRGCAALGRSSPLEARLVSRAGRCLVATAAVRVCSFVASWLVAGPGLLEAELEIGRLARGGCCQWRRARAEAQALEDAADHLRLVDGCQHAIPANGNCGRPPGPSSESCGERPRNPCRRERRESRAGGSAGVRGSTHGWPGRSGDRGSPQGCRPAAGGRLHWPAVRRGIPSRHAGSLPYCGARACADGGRPAKPALPRTPREDAWSPPRFGSAPAGGVIARTSPQGLDGDPRDGERSHGG